MIYKTKKVTIMKILKYKNGFVTHPGMMFAIAFILGVVVTILWAKQIISVSFPFCGS